jgi:hypothetical protein
VRNVPLQNRVTPHGSIIATTARGLLMGNRGCLHDGARRIRRQYRTTPWIICVLSFRDRRRSVMAPGRYTELFFLDEAVALAAGHRPCAECQRDRYRQFRDHWALANTDLSGVAHPAAADLDRILHHGRIDAAGRQVTYMASLPDLPDGTFIAGESAGEAYLVLREMLVPWAPGGYGRPRRRSRAADSRVLTPHSVVRALAHGYRPMLHPSAARHGE